MTADRDRADDAKLPALVFRPWPPRPAPLPWPARSVVRPCFVRAPAPVSPALDAPLPAAIDDQDPQRYRNSAARPPRFARFVAALQSRGGALGPAPAVWGMDPWQDAGTGAASRQPAALAETGGPGLGGRGSLAAIGRGLPRSAIRRSALLIGAASAAALLLVALFEPTGGQDRVPLVGPPAEAGGLVRAPPTADRYRLAAAPREPGLPAALPIASRPPAASNRLDRALPGKLEPPAGAAPAPPGIAPVRAAVRPELPRIEDVAAGFAAAGKFAALAVRIGALAEDPLYDLGQRLAQKGELAKAIEAYRMAAAANPGHAATYYDWGQLLQQQGDEAGAREKYLMTLERAPRHAFAHYNLGYICQRHGDYSQAIQHYQAAIAADPSFFWSYYNRGYIQQRLGHYREALADYRKSIEIAPDHALAYENIATILRYHEAE